MNPGNVRLALPGDEATLRDLRIRALRTDPAMFGSNLARELARSDADWRNWLTTGATFFYERDGRALGLVCAQLREHDGRAVELLSMWVDPSARGSIAATALVQAVVAWSQEQRAERLYLHVAVENPRGHRLYEKCGFVFTGKRSVRESDGFSDFEMAYAAAHERKD